MSRRTESPRTILAFHATVIGILLTFDLGVVVSLATTGAADWLIPWVLGIGFTCAVAYAVAVFMVAKNDPSKLMLGQVTGQEYAEIQRVVLGDSTTGERTTPVFEGHVVAEPVKPGTIAMEPPRQRAVTEENVIEHHQEGDA